MTAEERITRLEKAVARLAEIFKDHSHEANDLGSVEVNSLDYVAAKEIMRDFE